MVWWLVVAGGGGGDQLTYVKARAKSFLRVVAPAIGRSCGTTSGIFFFFAFPLLLRVGTLLSRPSPRLHYCRI